MREETHLSAHEYASEGGRVIDSWHIHGPGISWETAVRYGR